MSTFTKAPRAYYSNVVIITPSVLAGVVYPIAVKKIFDTDTTATSIAGLA